MYQCFYLFVFYFFQHRHDIIINMKKPGKVKITPTVQPKELPNQKKVSSLRNDGSQAKLAFTSDAKVELPSSSRKIERTRNRSNISMNMVSNREGTFGQRKVSKERNNSIQSKFLLKDLANNVVDKKKPKETQTRAEIDRENL